MSAGGWILRLYFLYIWSLHGFLFSRIDTCNVCMYIVQPLLHSVSVLCAPALQRRRRWNKCTVLLTWKLGVFVVSAPVAWGRGQWLFTMIRACIVQDIQWSEPTGTCRHLERSCQGQMGPMMTLNGHVTSMHLAGKRCLQNVVCGTGAGYYAQVVQLFEQQFHWCLFSMVLDGGKQEWVPPMYTVQGN